MMRAQDAEDMPRDQEALQAVDQIEAAKPSPTHLLVFVNGISGHAGNWKVVKRTLEESDKGNSADLLMLASTSSLKWQTFKGIDTCGKRLAIEIKKEVAAKPSLAYISAWGHSMGGLILRYAMGVLYDPGQRTIAGLQPRHFVFLATPHLGCGGTKLSQVPILGWFGKLPLIGIPLGPALRFFSTPFAKLVMRTSGKQLFFLDGMEDKKPLLVRLAQDNEEGLFLSALKSFPSRTLVANSSGDNVVCWANASLRKKADLPKFSKKDLKKAKGVMRSDKPEIGFWPISDTARHESASTSEISLRDDVRPEPEIMEAREGDGAAEAKEEDFPEPPKRKPYKAADGILKVLQELPWARIDVSFKGTIFGHFFAHNLLQVTREWVDWEGREGVKAIVEHFFGLERVLEEREECKQQLQEHGGEADLIHSNGGD